MDRNSVLGIIIIAVILVLWGIFQPQKKTDSEALQQQDTTEQTIQQAEIAENTVTEDRTDNVMAEAVQPEVDSVTSQDLLDNYGEYASFAAGENKFYTIENDKIILTVSTKGGRPYSVELKDYVTFGRDPVVLFDGDSTEFGITFLYNNRVISTNDLYFQPSDSLPVTVTDRSNTLSMKLPVNEGKYIEYRYTLEPGSNMMDFTIHMEGMEDIDTRDPSALDFTWDIYAEQHEQVKKTENWYTTIYYRHYGEDVDYFRARGNKETNEEEISTKLQWIAFKNQFFSSVIIAEDAFDNGYLKWTKLPDEDKYLKNFRAEFTIPFERTNEELINLKLYFGPSKYKLLKQYKEYELQNLVTVGNGVIRWINKFVIIPIFDWLSRFIGNFGIIILLLTIIIKIGLLPLTYRSYLSMARMRVLKPQIDEINKKFPKGKEVEKQQATMALYKKAGVSPLGGCLPQLLQFPILYAMFRFFPTSIELRQEGFLWAKDLSTYDPLISWNANVPLLGDHLSLFTLLMTVSTILSMKMNDTTGSTQQMPGMKTMMYIMPVTFLFVLNDFPSGLTYYYFLANIITIGQNFLFKRFIDEDEILRKIEEKKAKPVKKSKFQQRLEEMSKQNQKRPVKRR